MADIYGWQVLDANESVVYDHTVIMSRKIGHYDIPFMLTSASTANWSHRIENIPFEGGTPFCHITLVEGSFVAEGTKRYVFYFPEVRVGSNYVDISYNDRILSFPDDIGAAVWFGGMRVHYGVYNA